jgi:hypothetical protein
MFRVFVALFLCAGVAAQEKPLSIFPASSHSTLLNETTNGKLYRVLTPDGVDMKVIHVRGTADEMGRAQGELLGDVMVEFVDDKLPQFFKDEIGQIPMKGLPPFLQKLIKGAGEAVAPAVFETALEWVYNKQLPFFEKERWEPVAEINGIAEGICARGGAKACDAAALAKKLGKVNMLPELIKMSCTMFGAWGNTTTDGKLVQLRALDFGSGPFANYSVLTVYHPTNGNEFASLGFPGLVGLITGLSTKVSISEKVWETYDTPDLQPGTYEGETLTFVMRDMVQFANTKEEAIETARTAARTWAVFLGVGDESSQQFEIMGYREKEVQVFDPPNMTLVTNQTALANLVFIDRHPQPTHDPKMLVNALEMQINKRDKSQRISGRSTVQMPRHIGPTGDVHIAIYDWSARSLFVAVGKVNSDGNYGPEHSSEKSSSGEFMACNRSFVEFGMDSLWNASRW